MQMWRDELRALQAEINRRLKDKPMPTIVKDLNPSHFCLNGSDAKDVIVVNCGYEWEVVEAGPDTYVFEKASQCAPQRPNSKPHPGAKTIPSIGHTEIGRIDSGPITYQTPKKAKRKVWMVMLGDVLREASATILAGLALIALPVGVCLVGEAICDYEIDVPNTFLGAALMQFPASALLWIIFQLVKEWRTSAVKRAKGGA
jgi:hypothetical protein